jgi:hypothetical protein
MAENHHQHVFYRRVGMKFWTNYNASQHLITVIDDANQICQKYNESIPVPGELIHLTNSAECPLEVAEVENKPFAYFNSRALILTDNIKDPPLADVIVEADAYKRRLHFEVKVSIDPEFGTIFNGTNETYYKMKPDKNSLNLDKYRFTLYSSNNEIIHNEINYTQFIDLVETKLDELSGEHQSFQNQLALYSKQPVIDLFNIPPPAKIHEAHGLSDVPKSVYLSKIIPQVSILSPFRLFYVQLLLTLTIPFQPFIFAFSPAIFSFSLITNFLLSTALCKRVHLSPKAFCYTQLLLTQHLFKKISLRFNKLRRFSPSYKLKLSLFLALPVVLFLIYKLTCKNEKTNEKSESPPSKKKILKQLSMYSKLSWDSRINLSYHIIDHYPTDPCFKPYTDLWHSDGYNMIHDPKNFEIFESIYRTTSFASENIYSTNTNATPRTLPLPTHVFASENNVYSNTLKTTPRTLPIPVYKSESLTLVRNLKYEPLQPLSIEPFIDISPFRKNYFENTTAHFLSDQNTQEIINSSIFTNLFYLEILTPGSDLIGRCNILFIRGHLAVTTAHCLHNCTPTTILSLSNSSVQYSVPFSTVETFRIQRSGIDRDLVYVVFPKHYIPAQKDISSKFLPFNQIARHFNTTAVCTSYRKTNNHLVLTLHYTDMIFYSNNLAANDHQGNLYDFHYHRSTTSQGDCGAPLLILDKKSPQKILGIHAAGDADEGLSLCITTEELDFIKLYVTAQSLCIQDFSESLQFNSPLNFNKLEQFKISELRPGNFTPIATINNTIYIPTESKVQKSILYDKVFKPTTTPAILKSSATLNIYENNLRKYFSETSNISPTTLQYIKHRLIHRFGGVSYNKLSLEEAIKGNDILVPLDRTTSAGIPWIFYKEKTKGKTPWLGQNDHWIIDNVDLINKIDSFEQTVLTKNVIPPIFFLDQTKDERRPIEKVKNGKTRMFAIGPMHFSILFRKYFSWFDSHCKRHRITNGSLVGIDPMSSEWTKVYHHMSQINNPETNCYLAGDYSNFDGSLNRSILWTIFDAIVEIGKVDTTSPDYTIMTALWTCLTDSLHIHKQHIYQLNHSQPSGNPFTTIINTLYNLGLLDFCIYALLKADGKLVDDLDNHYHAYAYGDDNLIIFSDYLKQNIDPLDMTALLDMTGHTYTTDLKDDSTQAYRSIHDVSILKRKFYFCKDLFYCFAPLEIETILEMINWDKEKTYTSKLTQLFVNGDTMQRELLHHPELSYTVFWTEKALPALQTIGFKNQRVLPWSTLRALHASKMMSG